MSTAHYEPIRKLLEAKMQTDWAAATGIKFQNLPFEQPAQTAWVSFTIRFGLGVPASIGSVGTRLTRQVGVVAVQIFTPSGLGTKAALDLADRAANIFRYVTLADTGLTIRLGVPDARELPEKEHSYYGFLVTVPFEADGTF